LPIGIPRSWDCGVGEGCGIIRNHDHKKKKKKKKEKKKKKSLCSYMSVDRARLSDWRAIRGFVGVLLVGILLGLWGRDGVVVWGVGFVVVVVVVVMMIVGVRVWGQARDPGRGLVLVVFMDCGDGDVYQYG
jgi:hypothetical protein